jgi:hypothetical protein
VSKKINKIFGIGLNKTGTTTLKRCMQIFGYKHKSCSPELLKDVIEHNKFEQLYATVNQYDSFDDWPWPLIYKKLDKKYPNSRFILTLRKDVNTWLKSLKKHSLRTKPLDNCRIYAYKHHYPHGHEEDHIRQYHSHEKEVKEYFSNRPDDLLTVCWENGDGWKEICEFLNLDIPDKQFPHANSSKSINKSWEIRKRQIINRFYSLFV